MQCCASCGQTQDLRLYEVKSGEQVARRWYCAECSFSARRLGVKAEPAAAWIERAALRQLPLKLVGSGRASAQRG